MKRLETRGGMHNLSSTRGFTLAEVLVTLGIIGVVSAMTVPTLMQNYQKKSYVVQLHKVYNELSQALLQYQTDRNALNLKEAGFLSQAAMDDFVKTYFKSVKECDTTSSCFYDNYKDLSGNVISTYSTNIKSYVFTSGVSMRLLYYPKNNIIASAMIDINGQKGPNIGCRDLFYLYIYDNSVIDDNNNFEPAEAPLTYEQRENNFSLTNNGDGCFGKILNDNWEMNY